MNAEYEVKMLMAQLNGLLDALTDLLDSDEKLQFIAYRPELVSIKDEKDVLANGRKRIKVEVLDQWQHKLTVLDYYKKFYATEGYSTRFVSRSPGVIVSSLPAKMVINLVNQINLVKDNIKAIVQKGRDHLKRHEFIHQLFPQIMTEQLYRHINISQRQIRSIWFSWCSKRQVNQSYNIDEAIQWLAEQGAKPRKPFTEQEWQAHIDAVITKIQNGRYKNIQRQRTYRTFPVADYSHYEDGKLKTNRINAIMPWILLDQPEIKLPPGTGLTSFVAKESPIIAKSTGRSEVLFKPLKLIGVY